MEIKVTYDENIDCIVINVTGAVGYEDILPVRDKIINHPKFRQNINQLFDCSEGELNLTTEELERIASYYLENADQFGHSRKLALVVSRDLDYGMMRQYEVFSYSDPGVSVCVYRSLLEAREWLRKE